MDKIFEEFMLQRERSKTNLERWVNFEHTLRCLLCELVNPADRGFKEMKM